MKRRPRAEVKRDAPASPRRPVGASLHGATEARRGGAGSIAEAARRPRPGYRLRAMRAAPSLALVCLTACGGLRTSAEPTVEAGVLRATVGREGGRFGSDASPFFGLNVEVPPDAAPFPFAVEVRAFLPLTVELEGRVAVGPAFTLDAGGLVLGQAMRVRLPIDADLTRWAGASPEALRVIVGEPGAWTEVDGEVAAMGDAIEIEVDRFVKFVPTVRVELRDPCAVGEGCVRASPLAGAACATAFCVERLPRAEPAPDGRPGQALALDGDALVYSARDEGGWALVRRAPDADQTSLLARLEPTVPRLWGLALDRGREAWLGLGPGGNLRVVTGRPPQALDAEIDGHGAVVLSDGSIVLLRADGLRRQGVGELGPGPVVTPPLPPDRGGAWTRSGRRRSARSPASCWPRPRCSSSSSCSAPAGSPPTSGGSGVCRPRSRSVATPRSPSPPTTRPWSTAR